ncbi:glycosyltransferase, partial [Enterococcus faecium]|nr:glycosyltransferase [Enterococcus faecium]
MNISPLVSIIIPVYNIEKFIAKCLESLVSQTYKNIEIIIVN